MKCVVENCENKEELGNFKGNLCMPCYDYFKQKYTELRERKNNIYSQAYRNDINNCIDILSLAETLDLAKTWEERKI